MNERMELPDGWVETTLGEIISISSGKGLTQANQNSAGEYLVYGGNGIVGRHIEYLFENKTLIIGRVGVHCGNLHITKPKSWITDNAFVVDFNSCAFDITYLYYHLKVLNLNRYSSSTAQPVISQGKLYPVKIQICPLPEQHRIVAKIEALFTSLDRGIASLKTAQQQLKIYRQAVLKWAFEGKLTNEGVKDGELPQGWKWALSGDFFSFVTSGSRGWAKYYAEEGAIFIRITNLNFDTLDLDLRKEKIQYVAPPQNSEGIRTKVEEGDFLFSITGYLGMFAIAPKLDNAYVNQHVCLCRPKNGFSKKYLGYWIISKSGGHHHLNKNQKGAVKAGLNLEDLKSFPVPLAPLDEQHKIVAAIESRLSVCDKLEETILQSLQQAEALRQSVLKKAFAGQLVPQDPHDEPASVLLERILAERLKFTTSKIVKNKKSQK